MRFGVKVGPFYVSTSTRRRNRATGGPPSGCAILGLLLAVLVAALSVIPSPWRWVTLAGVTVLGLVIAGMVSDRRDAARSRAAEQQAATDAAVNAIKPGDRVRLVSAKYAGASGLQPGDLGTVTGADDEWGIKTIEVSWDNGSEHGLVPGPDQFELVRDADVGGDEVDTSLEQEEDL